MMLDEEWYVVEFLKRAPFEPSEIYGGSRDGNIRDASGAIVTNTGGHELNSEIIAYILNAYAAHHSGGTLTRED